MRNYKFRLYPNKVAEVELQRNLDECRWLYNRLLDSMNKAYANGRRLSRGETQSMIVKLKEGEHPELKNVYSKTLQMVNQQLWYNIHSLSGRKKKGYKVGKLKFKSYDKFNSIFFNQSGFHFGNNKIILSKIGKVKAEFHREIKGSVKGIIVSKSASKWYACVQVDNKEQEKHQIKVTTDSKNRAVGLDMGLKNFVVDSDQKKIANPKFLEKTKDNIAALNRKLHKRVRGSKRRNKAKLRLNDVYEHLANQRKDFAHKLSMEYVKNYAIIAVEDLNIQGMARNHKLSKSIYDAAWRQFVSFLSYKAEACGRILIKVDPKYTTQRCSVCGNINKGEDHLDLSQRIFKCSACGIELDRDYNAARNILIMAFEVGREPASKLVENGPLHRIKPIESVKSMQVSLVKREAPFERLR